MTNKPKYYLDVFLCDWKQLGEWDCICDVPKSKRRYGGIFDMTPHYHGGYKINSMFMEFDTKEGRDQMAKECFDEKGFLIAFGEEK